MQLDDDSTPVRQVPGVISLCETLGIEAGEGRRQFRQLLRDWRSNHRTVSGVSGLDITKWTSETDRYDLGVMARECLEFLEMTGYAREYWPSSGRASPQARLKYPKDETKIAKLLRQLIWRQNHVALKNARKGRSDLDDDDYVSEKSRFFSEQSPPLSSRRRSTQRRAQLSHGPILDKPTMDRSASWENDEDGGNHGTFTKTVTLKDTQSQMHQMHRPSGDPASIDSMDAPIPELSARSTRVLNRPYQGNVSPVQAKGLVATFPGAEDYNMHNEEYHKQRTLSRPKRPRRNQNHGMRKSTKRKYLSESPDDNNKRPTAAGEEEPEAPGLPPVARPCQRRRSNLPLSKAPDDIWDVSDTSSSDSPDEGDSDPEDSVQRTNDRARSSVSKDTTHRTHGKLPRSSTPDSSALSHIDHQHSHSSRGPELGESYHSQRAPSTPQPSSSAPTPSRSGQPSLAAKPRVEIFVFAACRIQKWPGGSIKDRGLDTIFDEVSALISRNNIQSIKFKLEPLNKTETPLKYFIERSEKEPFELVIQRFTQRMKERRKAGEARFTISLEPVFERQGAAEAEAAQVSQSDEDI